MLKGCVPLLPLLVIVCDSPSTSSARNRDPYMMIRQLQLKVTLTSDRVRM
jgi:hypothetical protein